MVYNSIATRYTACMATDLYSVLGVKRGASDKDIKAAFRKLAREHHPDVNPGDVASEERFKEISQAHEVLGDAKNRAAYDKYGDQWQHADQIEEMQRRQGDAPGGFPVGVGSRAAPAARPTRSRATSETCLVAAPRRPAVLRGMPPRGRGRWRALRQLVPARGRPAEGAGPRTHGQRDAERGLQRGEAHRPTQCRRRRREPDRGRHPRRGRRRPADSDRRQGAPGVQGGASGDLFLRVRVQPHASSSGTATTCASWSMCRRQTPRSAEKCMCPR